jgi:hypothetical protein
MERTRETTQLASPKDYQESGRVFVKKLEKVQDFLSDIVGVLVGFLLVMFLAFSIGMSLFIFIREFFL